MSKKAINPLKHVFQKGDPQKPIKVYSASVSLRMPSMISFKPRLIRLVVVVNIGNGSLRVSCSFVAWAALKEKSGGKSCSQAAGLLVVLEYGVTAQWSFNGTHMISEDNVVKGMLEKMSRELELRVKEQELRVKLELRVKELSEENGDLRDICEKNAIHCEEFLGARRHRRHAANLCHQSSGPASAERSCAH